MPRKGKDLPQTYTMMVKAAGDKKATSRLYKDQDATADADIKLSELIYSSAEELAAVLDRDEHITLLDTATIKKRAIGYLRACGEAACFPSMTGYARSMGLTVRALNDFRRKHPGHETSVFLELFHDLCADLLAAAAIRNGSGVNAIFAIFLEKARFSWRDTTTLEIAPPPDPLGGEPVDPEQIAQKYAYLSAEE